MENAKQFSAAVQRTVSTVLVVSLSVMVVLTFVDVVGRRLFNTPVFGATDLTEHLMAVIVFAGLPLLTAQRGHLSIDLFDAWLLRPQYRWWHKAVDLLIAAVLGLIAWRYFLSVHEALEIKEVSPALTIPRAWAYGFIAATSAIAAVAALFVGAPVHHTQTEEFAS
ncbi:MAG: TRAP transporter small permease [Burkholderiaceae bacterium]